MNKINKGIGHYRTKHEHGDLEKAFADEWEKINNEENLLEGLYLYRKNGKYNMTNKERIAAATAIQWLGSNCGFAFLNEVVKKCGYTIDDEQARKIRQRKFEEEVKKMQKERLERIEEQRKFRLKHKYKFINMEEKQYEMS